MCTGHCFVMALVLVIYSWKCGRCLSRINKLLGNGGDTARILSSNLPLAHCVWGWADSSLKWFIFLSAAGRSVWGISAALSSFYWWWLRLFVALIPLQISKKWVPSALSLRKSHSRDNIHQEMLCCSGFCSAKVTQSLLQNQFCLAKTSSSRSREMLESKYPEIWEGFALLAPAGVSCCPEQKGLKEGCVFLLPNTSGQGLVLHSQPRVWGLRGCADLAYTHFQGFFLLYFFFFSSLGLILSKGSPEIPQGIFQAQRHPCISITPTHFLNISL